jgi:hypothetical protein
VGCLLRIILVIVIIVIIVVVIAFFKGWFTIGGVG